MKKITFIGAGSTIFARNVLGDCLLTNSLKDAEIALYDIDSSRLEESELIINAMNDSFNNGNAKISTYCGLESRKEALRNADFVINAIQVGGYKPSTVIDFEIPKKYGLRQTIADTLGIGGIFRALRTIPVMLDLASDMQEVCPDAWLLNYTNPMCMLTGAMLRYTPIKTVGLCHSVQSCIPDLIKQLGFTDLKVEDTKWHIAGINHMAWLLEVTHAHTGENLYPRIKARAKEMNAAAFAEPSKQHDDMVRFELMRVLGYYITESSEHNAEYSNFWIKSKYPELVEKFNIPIDEYLRRCVEQIEDWNNTKDTLLNKKNIEHTRSREYASYIMDAITTNIPYTIHGNVLNKGLITNLPTYACVEVPCLVNRNGVQPCIVGELPPQCAALNLTNINVQELTIQAAITKKRDYIYHAAMLDPHTSSELSIDDITSMCDELIEAHGEYLPTYT